jgi:hypothetical protein
MTLSRTSQRVWWFVGMALAVAAVYLLAGFQYAR